MIEMAPAATNSGSIQASDGVVRIPGILHLNEGEARGPPGHPDVPDGSILGECVLQVVSISIIPQSSDVNFALRVPVSVSHFVCYFIFNSSGKNQLKVLLYFLGLCLLTAVWRESTAKLSTDSFQKS
jgi:hypothetical protein